MLSSACPEPAEGSKPDGGGEKITLRRAQGDLRVGTPDEFSCPDAEVVNTFRLEQIRNEK
jgi:hypothetical protein